MYLLRSFGNWNRRIVSFIPFHRSWCTSEGSHIFDEMAVAGKGHPSSPSSWTITLHLTHPYPRFYLGHCNSDALAEHTVDRLQPPYFKVIPEGHRKTCLRTWRHWSHLTHDQIHIFDLSTFSTLQSPVSQIQSTHKDWGPLLTEKVYTLLASFPPTTFHHPTQPHWEKEGCSPLSSLSESNGDFYNEMLCKCRLFCQEHLHFSSFTVRLVRDFSLCFCGHGDGSIPFYSFLFPSTEVTSTLGVRLFEFEFWMLLNNWTNCRQVM